MKYWLLKTDAETYSWANLVKDKKTEWTGVRNYEARNNMKKMALGDFVFIYESIKNPCVVGIAKVISKAHPDSTDTLGIWWCVDIAAVQALKRPVSLSEIKEIAACKNMMLIKRSRLSVQSVTGKEWEIIVNLK